MLRKSKSLYRGYHCLRLFRQRGKRDAFLRHQEDIFGFQGDDLEQLSRIALHPPVFWERELLAINEQYAHDLTLKRFLGLDAGTPLGVIVEHGLVLNKSLVENHLSFPFARRNIVMSRARSEYLASMGVRSTAIGPYLHYERPLFGPAAMESLKKRLGKTLLFFPSHSTQEICVADSYRDLSAMLVDLKSRHHFDTVLVCGYFIDIENGLFDCIQKQEGMQFISCGHRLGPAFLALLKTWLLLADVVASNSLGTQAGYSLLCGKPYWVVGGHDITRFYAGDQKMVASERQATLQPLIGSQPMTFEGLEAMFRNESHVISQDVLDCVAGLWGFEDVLTQEQLYRALF